MPIPWQIWAPPLDPPAEDGLPQELAEEIAATWWDSDPWLAAALMWEAYALMQQPTPSVASVSTGAQTVSYNPPGGRWALAMARADWFRQQRGNLISVPLEVVTPGDQLAPLDWWQRNLEVPP